jgi:drug/metabolite transporter (DMT)-like permease
MWAAFLTTLLFSISTVSGGRSARLLGGTEANFWRLCFAATLLAIYAHTAGRGLTGAGLPVFFVSGCIGFGIGDMALYQALPRLGSRLSVLLTLCLSSPLAAFMEWAWLGTGLTWLEVACALVILGGVALALAPGAHWPSHSHGRELAWGLGFGLLASFCQALGAVLSRIAFATGIRAGENMDGITAAYQRILGGVLIGTFVYLAVKQFERSRSRSRSRSGAGFRSGEGTETSGDPNPSSNRGDASRAERWRQAWPWLILNGLTGPTLGVSFYQWALKSTKTGVVLPIVALTPIVIIPFSYWIERERPSPRSLCGGALAVAGAAALAWATHR